VWVVLLARAVDSLEDHDHVDVEDSVVEDQLGVVALEEGEDGPVEPEEPPDPVMTKLAFTPWGTVTTQNAPPPAPLVELPTISLTPFWLGSMAHGRPLHPPPSHVISTPQLGIVLRKGVACSR
jgi:hypothetical protein